jgi:hypothetical protein
MSSHRGEIVMNTLINLNTRTSILALAACTLVAATALAPTSASAWSGVGHRPAANWGSGGTTAARPSQASWTGNGMSRMPASTNSWQSHQSSWVGYHPSWHPSWRPTYNTGTSYWHRPATYWTGSNSYGSTYAPAPSYYAPAPVTYAPTTYAPAPVTYAPAPTTYAPTPAVYAPTPAYAPPAPAYAPAPAAYTPPPPAQGCNCLSKTYMQDGTAVFSDNCTKETAMVAPAAPQQQTGYQPH